MFNSYWTQKQPTKTKANSELAELHGYNYQAIFSKKRTSINMGPNWKVYGVVTL
jgi:hypothetical protein